MNRDVRFRAAFGRLIYWSSLAMLAFGVFARMITSIYYARYPNQEPSPDTLLLSTLLWIAFWIGLSRLGLWIKGR